MKQPWTVVASTVCTISLPTVTNGAMYLVGSHAVWWGGTQFGGLARHVVGSHAVPGWVEVCGSAYSSKYDGNFRICSSGPCLTSFTMPVVGDRIVTQAP